MKQTKPVQHKQTLSPTLIGFTWVVCCGLVDWSSGTELSLSAFYLPGVALVAWYSGRNRGVLLALCAAFTWLLADYASGANYSSRLIPYWNASIRLSFFLITALLTSEVRSRQRTEAILRGQKDILRSILNSMRDGVVVADGDGTIIAFNPAAEEIFANNPVGGDAMQWVSEVESFQLDGFDPQTDKSSPLRLAVSGMLPGGVEIKLHKPDDADSRVLAVTSLPLLDHHRQPAGVVMVFADQTARRMLECQIAEASEREQRRIGQDLHDGVCQHLVGVAFAAGSLQDTLESRSLKAEAAAAGEIANLINAGISEARNLAHGLYPAGLEEGIELALRALATKTQDRTGIACVATFNGDKPQIDPVSEVHLYRIAQECVSNACRHGKPHAVEISMKNDERRLSLAVSDNGCGMDRSPPPGRGIGLSLIQYRANLMGGTLEIETKPGAGTRVICEVPATPPAGTTNDSH